MGAIRPSAAERFQAWLVTGPAGHLWSTLADVAVICARAWRRRGR